MIIDDAEIGVNMEDYHGCIKINYVEMDGL